MSCCAVLLAACVRDQKVASNPAAPAGDARREADVILFTDFGADPTGTRDCTGAARKAVESCRSLQHPTLQFPRGRYRFAAPDSAHLRIFDFQDLSGLTVDGQGSELLFAGRAHPFEFTLCHGVTIENLTIDWPEPPFSQGLVTATNDWSIDLEIDPGYTVPERLEDLYALMDYDSATREPIGDLDVFATAFASLERIGPRVVRITLKRPPEPLKARFIHDTIQRLPGALMVLRHNLVFGDQVIDLAQCSQVLIDRVTVYSGPGMAVAADRVDGLEARHLQVIPKPGTDRLMSTILDAFHGGFMTGEVRVEDCTFEAMGDDGVNIYTKYYTTTAVHGTDGLQMATISPGVPGPAPHPGDIMELCKSSDLVPYAHATVCRAGWNPATKLFTLTFTSPVSPVMAVGDLLVNTRFAAKLRVERCTIGDNRGRGMLISTRDVLVDHCTIHGCTYEGVLLLGVPLRQAMGPAQVTLRGNLITDCGGAGIFVPQGASRPRPGATTDVTIEDNVIHGFTRTDSRTATRVRLLYPHMLGVSAGICLTGVNRGAIRGNSVEGYPVAIALAACQGIAVQENKWAEQARLLTDETTAAASQLGTKKRWTFVMMGDPYNRSYGYIASWR